MTIIEISEEDYYAWLGKPHNPPDASVSEAIFDEEYYRVFDRVAAVMSEYGENDAFGDGDYCLEPRICSSRGLGLVITNPEILASPLLQSLQMILVQHAPHWEIYLGSGECDFGVFVGPSSVRVWRSNPSVLVELNQCVEDDF